jgi:hypothetical protein
MFAQAYDLNGPPFANELEVACDGFQAIALAEILHKETHQLTCMGR